MLRTVLNRLDPHEAPLFALIGVWTAVMIAVPILRWTVGDSVFPVDVIAGVLSQTLASLSAVRFVWGRRKTLILALVILIGAWSVEFIGHTTGFPFGAYDYTNVLQPQLGGVPIWIPLAWLMMLPPAWVVAHLLTGQREGWQGRLIFIGWSALAFTAWDLFLDPQMVSWNLWVWENPGTFNYFGIPWSNYAGWFLTSLIMTAIASFIAPVRKLPIAPLLTLYALTWFLETFGLILFWQLPGAGIVGGVVMGALLFAALWRLAHQQTDIHADAFEPPLDNHRATITPRKSRSSL